MYLASQSQAKVNKKRAERSQEAAFVLALNKAHVFALNTTQILRLNKADVVALNAAHVLRLNNEVFSLQRRSYEQHLTCLGEFGL